jgi:hypothetical protein
MQRSCKCGEIYLAKSLNGASSRILNCPGTKSRLFEGPETVFGLINGTSDSEGDFGAKKVEGPSKSRDFVHGIILNNKIIPQSDFRDTAPL